MKKDNLWKKWNTKKLNEKKYHLFKVCIRGLLCLKCPQGPEVWLKLLLQSFSAVLNFRAVYLLIGLTGLSDSMLKDLAFSRIFL